MWVINLILLLITLSLGYYIKFTAYKKNSTFYHFLGSMIFILAMLMLGTIYVHYTYHHNFHLYVDLFKLYMPAILKLILFLGMFYISTEFCIFLVFYSLQFIKLRIQEPQITHKKDED